MRLAAALVGSLLAWGLFAGAGAVRGGDSAPTAGVRVRFGDHGVEFYPARSPEQPVARRSPRVMHVQYTRTEREEESSAPPRNEGEAAAIAAHVPDTAVPDSAQTSAVQVKARPPAHEAAAAEQRPEPQSSRETTRRIEQRDSADEAPLIDYRLASRIPAVVLEDEPAARPTVMSAPPRTVPVPSVRFTESSEKSSGAVSAPEPDDVQETTASRRSSLVSPRSLAAYSPPIEPDGLQDIASLKADPALENDEGLRPIGEVGVDIRPEVGELPTNYAAPRFARVGEMREPPGAKRDWRMYNFNWECKGLCYGPLRFQEVNLERHGYSLGLAQPAVSAAHFFATLPLLPYKMTVNKARDCQYCLGYYRPGSYAPFQRNRMPLRLDGAMVELLTITGTVFVLP